jgi:hypothetical protein
VAARQQQRVERSLVDGLIEQGARNSGLAIMAS